MVSRTVRGWKSNPVMLLGVALLVGVGAWHGPALGETGDAESSSQQAARIAELIEQLDADAWSDRQAAVEALTAIGEPALPALERAAEADNAQVASQARAVLRAIDEARKSAWRERFIETGQWPEDRPRPAWDAFTGQFEEVGQSHRALYAALEREVAPLLAKVEAYARAKGQKDGDQAVEQASAALAAAVGEIKQELRTHGMGQRKAKMAEGPTLSNLGAKLVGLCFALAATDREDLDDSARHLAIAQQIVGQTRGTDKPGLGFPTDDPKQAEAIASLFDASIIKSYPEDRIDSQLSTLDRLGRHDAARRVARQVAAEVQPGRIPMGKKERVDAAAMLARYGEGEADIRAAVWLLASEDSRRIALPGKGKMKVSDLTAGEVAMTAICRMLDEKPDRFGGPIVSPKPAVFGGIEIGDFESWTEFVKARGELLDWLDERDDLPESVRDAVKKFREMHESKQAAPADRQEQGDEQ